MLAPYKDKKRQPKPKDKCLENSKMYRCDAEVSQNTPQSFPPAVHSTCSSLTGMMCMVQVNTPPHFVSTITATTTTIAITIKHHGSRQTDSDIISYTILQLHPIHNLLLRFSIFFRTIKVMKMKRRRTMKTDEDGDEGLGKRNEEEDERDEQTSN
ncbi:hypothetical protein E2C01_028539 [Portunus trituberculatus]|uniref:Uncharacterized protein n=1 Tax=Portunus trituberculatus TaxID=210409 RepID=A0A5B7ERY9_PORTR|nr:hypothetical protein [Portunus trituberculatus]